jgi:hypothetical protein
VNRIKQLGTPTIVVLVTAMAGCSTEQPSHQPPFKKISRTECVTQGGRVVGGFTHSDYRCEWPTKDAGRTCWSNSDCEGVCEVPGGALRESTAECERTCPTATKKLASGEPCACVPTLEYSVPVGTHMNGTCSIKRYDDKTVNCMDLYIDSGVVTKAPCFEE